MRTSSRQTAAAAGPRRQPRDTKQAAELLGEMEGESHLNMRQRCSAAAALQSLVCSPACQLTGDRDWPAANLGRVSCVPTRLQSQQANHRGCVAIVIRTRCVLLPTRFFIYFQKG